MTKEDTGAEQIPTPPLDHLPTSEKGATYSVWGGTRTNRVLQFNTATQVRHVENGEAFKEGGRSWGQWKGGCMQRSELKRGESEM